MNYKTVICPVCKATLEIEEDDRLKACYGQGHITLREWQDKQKKKDNDE